MIGVSSLDLLAFPAALQPTGCIAAVIDARRGELFYGLLPAGARRRAAPDRARRSARPTTSPPSCSRRPSETLLVGDGAVPLRRACFAGRPDVEIVGGDLAYPSARSLVQLAHAQALREEWVSPWEIEPLYLRKPDAEINWSTRDEGVMASRPPADRRRRRDPAPTLDGRDHARCAGATCRGVLRIEAPGVPAAVVARPVPGASCAAAEPRVPRRPGRRARWSGYAGLLMVADDGHITTVAVDPAWHRHGIGTRLLLAAGRAAPWRGAEQLTLEVRCRNAGAQALYRRFGFAPAGVRKAYYADNGEDALVMWAHDIARRLRRALRHRGRDRRADRAQGFDAAPTAVRPSRRRS